ncbi:MAG: hypothetical protein VCB06_05175, partial [Alphaproteobacteria bacterium]
CILHYACDICRAEYVCSIGRPKMRTGSIADRPLTAGADIVLVIDDIASLRSNVVDFLALEGFRSSEVADGKIVLSYALHVAPSVVPLVIKMLAIDGYSAAKLIAKLF